MKDKLTVALFLVVLLGLFAANVFMPDAPLSFGERRRLAQLPKLSASDVMSGKFMGDFDKYSTDQFVGRELFRRLKTSVDQSILQKKDSNGLFRVGDGAFSIEYPLQENNVDFMCERLNVLYDRYLSGMNVYFCIVPDKNYYLPRDGSYLLMDYNKLGAMMQEKLPAGIGHIEIYDALSAENYFLSDGHWRQESLRPVTQALGDAMGYSASFDPASYEHLSYNPFYGAYYGQLAGLASADTIVWLENDVTRSAVVTSLGHPGQEKLPIYNTDGLTGMDSYDVFLYGAQPLITLDNPLNTAGRELILFRDSFGSSLAPIMLEDYSRITLVDIRYITQDLLAEYIEFGEQDVLLMFSSTIINNSIGIIR